eukprot:TRINITY_DN3269_c0_g1_i5.p1 TRINITY_DN3269_c0_g1~~TRINITY_DN3269_c0_g1_i5.p1  ORF type:complete len:262 (-),score=14.90 TRINITY_DN3269_c0_g1_i5:62-787(-)
MCIRDRYSRTHPNGEQEHTSRTQSFEDPNLLLSQTQPKTCLVPPIVNSNKQTVLDFSGEIIEKFIVIEQITALIFGSECGQFRWPPRVFLYSRIPPHIHPQRNLGYDPHALNNFYCSKFPNGTTRKKRGILARLPHSSCSNACCLVHSKKSLLLNLTLDDSKTVQSLFSMLSPDYYEGPAISCRLDNSNLLVISTRKQMQIVEPSNLSIIKRSLRLPKMHEIIEIVPRSQDILSLLSLIHI